MYFSSLEVVWFSFFGLQKIAQYHFYIMLLKVVCSSQKDFFVYVLSWVLLKVK